MIQSFVIDDSKIWHNRELYTKSIRVININRKYEKSYATQMYSVRHGKIMIPRMMTVLKLPN
jgi:hypothetical protein